MKQIETKGNESSVSECYHNISREVKRMRVNTNELISSVNRNKSLEQHGYNELFYIAVPEFCKTKDKNCRQFARKTR